MFFFGVGFLLTVSVPSSSQQRDPDVKLKVVIIRHAEKPEEGDNLCPKGLHRALALPAVLDTVTGVPDFTYVPRLNLGSTTRSARMFQTVTPFAVQHNLTINTSYKQDDVAGLTADVMRRSGVVLVVWNHSNIPDMAKAFGVKEKMKWPHDDYDSIWVLEFRKKNKSPSIKILKQNIHLEGDCN